MNTKIRIKAVVEKNNMTVHLKKAHTVFEDKTHTILTDDVFTFVDFFYKTHKRIRRSQTTQKPIDESYAFYWQQAKNFYYAAKQLPIESAPLPMYYAMLNAAKSMILYKTKDVDKTLKNLESHGLHEFGGTTTKNRLDDIMIERYDHGVFAEFSKTLDSDFDNMWKNKKQGGHFSVKDLLYQLAFIHRAYATTYSLAKNQELFVPLESGHSPTYYRFSDGKQYIVAMLQKSFFKATAINIPQDIADSLPSCFRVYATNDFRIVSSSSIAAKEVKICYAKYRRCFQYISSANKLWYIKRSKVNGNEIKSIDSLSLIMAITHRLSEIVRYKPEQLEKLLAGRENWILHEYINLAMDQFFDEIACEITGLEIMNTRTKPNT